MKRSPLTQVVATLVLATATLPGTAWAQAAPLAVPAPSQTPAPAPRPPAPEPSERIVYGEAPSQFIEVYRPTGPGPHPVVVFIHGGCYVTREGGVRMFRRSGAELAERGIVAWNIEYRRTDEAGAAFPGLFQDVATATDRLHAEAGRLNIDLDRVVVAGHSAGGHLALWSAGRERIASDSPVRTDDPVMPMAVVAVAGPGAFEGLKPVLDQFCGPETFDRLLGVPTPERPDIYADTSPDRLLPLGIPIQLIVGTRDEVVPPVFVEGFAQMARAKGDTVAVDIIEGADHIDPIDVRTPAWPRVRDAILTAAGLR